MKRRIVAMLVVGSLATLTGACGPRRCTTDCPFSQDGATDADAMPADAVIPSYTLDPTDAIIALRDQTPVRRSFQVLFHPSDGSTAPVSNVTFRIDDATLGAFDGATFVSHGSVGSTMVHADFSHDGRADSLSTPLTIRRVFEVINGIPDDAHAAFDGPATNDSSRGSLVDYPLDGALIPQNLPPFDVQWERGTTGDWYRVVVQRPHAEIDTFVQHDGDSFGFETAIDATAWQSLLGIEPDAPITIRVDRLDIATHTVLAGAPVSIRIARASLFGDIYYWQAPNTDGTGPQQQRLARIDIANGHRDLLVPTPPYSGPTPSGPNDQSRCVGCHAISRDGRWASTVTGTGMNAMFDLTGDLDVDPAPTRYPPLPPPMQQPGPFFTSSFNADGTRLVIATYYTIGRGTGLAMVDARNGASIATTGLPGVPATTPRWSPDGNSIAFISNGDDSEDGSATGDLELLPQTAPDVFASPRVLHQGGDLSTASERGTADSHPDFSPDSVWIAFQHGTQSASRHRPPSALYLIPTRGGAPIRLHASSGGLDGHNAFWPSFSPFVTHEADGASHYWLAFVSFRDYGNSVAGTLGLRRPQIWISAVDTAPEASRDPSHVPFRLGGQDLSSTNLAPAWAGPPCRENGEATDRPSRCCSNNADATTCIAPATCRALGTTCSADSDCCATLACQSHLCVPASTGSPR